jgi:hypothetical protein
MSSVRISTSASAVSRIEASLRTPAAPIVWNGKTDAAPIRVSTVSATATSCVPALRRGAISTVPQRWHTAFSCDAMPGAR